MIRLITDSAADFEPGELERMQVTCIPLSVMFADKEYRENVDLTKDRFYELLLAGSQNPKTSQTSPQILIDLFEQAHAQGDGAIYITLSSALSGTYQTAVMTLNMLGYEDCHVVDSLNATGGQRLLVEYAVKLRDEGKNAEEIIQSLENIRDRIVLYACINTLEYLYRGGRISQTAYKLGTLANIKPIIEVDTQGRVGVPAKAMGMRKGMDCLCKRVEERKPDDNFPFYVMYTNNIDVARELAQRLAKNGREVPDNRIIQVGAAIGSHIGPDACGIVYVGE